MTRVTATFLNFYAEVIFLSFLDSPSKLKEINFLSFPSSASSPPSSQIEYFTSVIDSSSKIGANNLSEVFAIVSKAGQKLYPFCDLNQSYKFADPQSLKE